MGLSDKEEAVVAEDLHLEAVAEVPEVVEVLEVSGVPVAERALSSPSTRATSPSRSAT